jgi:hypothetical protein
MTTPTDQLKSIQSRIDELEQTISDRSEQIKARTLKLKDELQDELSPAEMVRKHPFEAAGGVFLAGLILGRGIRGAFGRKKIDAPTVSPAAEPVHAKHATSGIVVEILHAGKDLALTYLKHYLDQKSKKPKT